MEETAVTLERAETERGELVLRYRRGAGGETIYEIISNGCFLMASTNAISAEQLAYLTLQALEGRPALRVLIGGLGIGYTLNAALAHPNVAHVTVVELEPLVVDWARTHFATLNGDALRDARVVVRVGDLMHHLATATERYDAILLDVDNGPGWLVFEENAALYTLSSLQRIRQLLTAGGVLGVWSAESVAEFLERLRTVFVWADETEVQETDERGSAQAYFIYRARNAAHP
ncbi:MAG: spermidine synthase [Anaerolineae bacterium]|jgi:spermidine synthase